MNKRREPEGGEEQPDTKKHSPGSFVLRDTRDIGEARGYFAAKLDTSGAVLAKLFAEVKAGQNDVTYMGEPALPMIRKAVGDVDASQEIYFNIVENDFVLNVPQFAERTIIVLMTGAELAALEFNERAPPTVDQQPAVERRGRGIDDDNDTEPDIDEVPVVNEVDSYDLFELVKSMKDNKSSEEEMRIVASNFIENYHKSLFEHPAERQPFLYNRMSLWATIITKLRDLEKKNKGWPAFVYYDCVSHNVFATTDDLKETDKLRLLFATNDVLETFEFRRYSPSHEIKYYDRLIQLLEDEPRSQRTLRYGNKSLNQNLADAYPVLTENDNLTPYALMFYPATCEFSILRLAFSVDRTQFEDLHAKINDHKRNYGAILLRQTYESMFAKLWDEEISATAFPALAHSAEFQAVLDNNSIPGISGNPKFVNSSSLYWNTSRYSALLNELCRNELCNVACPQTQRGEVLFIALAIYRNYVDNSLSLSESVDTYGLFRITQGSKSEQAVKYCAQINNIETENETNTSYEKFFEDCIVLTRYGNFRDDETLRWQQIFPISLTYISAFGKWQGGMQRVANAAEFRILGNLDEDSFKILRNVAFEYQDACLAVWSSGQSYISALQNQSNMDVLVSHEINNFVVEILQGIENSPDSPIEMRLLDVTAREADLEVVDDMLNDKPYTNWPALTANRKSLIDYINRIRSANQSEQCILLDKASRTIEFFTEEGGPIAIYESVIERNANSIVLYSRFKPRRRIRKVLLLESLRPVVSLLVQPDEELERAGEDDDREREEKERLERERLRTKRGPGSFADGNHEHQQFILLVKHNLYPAQHGNTAWREMMFLATTVYRKYIEFPRTEQTIGNRSQFDLWTQFVRKNVASQTTLLSFISVAKKRLLLLLSLFPADPRKAYDVFLDETLEQCIKNADKRDIMYTIDYVDLARRYEIGKGQLQKTLEYLYENYYVPIGPVPDKFLRFNRTLNTYIDQPTATDLALTEETRRCFAEDIDITEKNIVVLFHPLGLEGAVEVYKELLSLYKDNAPLFVGREPLRVLVDRAVQLMGTDRRNGASVYLRMRVVNAQNVYSVGAVPRNINVGYVVKFTDNSTASHPFSLADELNVKLLFTL